MSPHGARDDIDGITVLNHVDICASDSATEPNPSTFCNLSQEETQQIFGLDTYMTKYGSQGAGHPDLRELDSVEELREWSLDVPFGLATVTVLRCPEDRQCLRPGCMEGKRVCAQCQLPLCRECKPYLSREWKPDLQCAEPSMPPFCLGNDMMVFFAPRELYTLDVTVMEMLCASVCITSMICFTLETKYRNQLSQGGSVHPYDWTLHMARHRMGSRGNVTSFPLPWEALLQMLQQGEDNTHPPQLPWVGQDLADKVSILLKPTKTMARKQLHSLSIKLMCAVLW